MAGGKLTPRQKMINMMYLVLTALLAMNVSSEVLDAFKLVEEGIGRSNVVLQEKVTAIDEAFELQKKDNEKAGPLHEKSQEVSAVAKDLYDYIEGIKTTILSAEYSGSDEEGNLLKKDDIDNPTRLLADDQSQAFIGLELQNKINAAKDEFKAVISSVDGLDEAQVDDIIAQMTLKADDYPEFEKPKDKWYYKNFFHVPAAGVLTILTKLQNDVVSTESAINEKLLNQIGALDFKFDKLRATVQAEKAYLPGGAAYEANIFLTASSSGIVAETHVGSLNWDLFEADTSAGGSGYLPFNSETESPFNGESTIIEGGAYSRTASVGQNSYEGAIKIKNPGGGFDWYPFESTFEGAAPGGFSIAPTKMNVLYIGVDNPLSITIGDAKPGSERASISQGSLSGSGNSWTAKVSTVGTATITASGVNASTGESTAANSMEFRVKRIPDPIPTLGGTLTGGNIQKGTLAAQSGVIALLKDFDFDAKFSVVSYDFILSTQGEILPARGISGPLLNSQVKALIQRAKSNDYVIFENIKVKGPDGTTRKISSITFKIV